MIMVSGLIDIYIKRKNDNDSYTSSDNSNISDITYDDSDNYTSLLSCLDYFPFQISEFRMKYK